MDPEQMFLAFRDAYLEASKAKEIAERDAQQETRQAHVEMQEMDAWDSYALEALKVSATVDANSATHCAAFANELLKQRRATFLMGDDVES
jgi:uncharacterized membrane protein